jgi:hypothetical protein
MGKKLLIPYGHYQQYRVAAVGSVDSKLQEDLMSADMDFEAISYPNSFGHTAPFDTYIFSTKSDYDCYVKAIEILNIGGIHRCDFLKDPSVLNRTQTEVNFEEDYWVNVSKMDRDYHIIIDNTGYADKMEKRLNIPHTLEKKKKHDI